MLKEITLQNFRGFEDHVVPFLPTTVVVGRNNAGKSTIVEALRLISLAVTYAKNRPYVPGSWTISRHARRAQTAAPTLLNLEINTDTVFHRYGEPPASVVASFASGATVEISIDRDQIRAWFRTPKQDALTHVSILPQVAPVAKEERVLNADYVRGAVSSVLAPLHFRNQVYLMDEFFPEFQRVTEATWPQLRVFPPEIVHETLAVQKLAMMVTDRDFTAEIGWMGHGLQMWLQTMWFLTRAKEHQTVILDEPDVYMHADLQRRLIRLLKSQKKQVIIATHSAEIMAEVEPEEILIVKKDERRSQFAPNLPVAQEILAGLGSVHNLQLARLATAGRYVFVEGDDISILKRFQDTLFPTSNMPLDTISMPISGWSGWHYAVGTAQFLTNTAGSNLVRYCILDRDYHAPAEITAREADAVKRKIELHIWKRKELENYLLVPGAISRFIAGKEPRKKPTPQEITSQIDAIAKSLRGDVRDAIGTELQNQNRKHTFATASKEADNYLAGAWKTRADRWALIPGKTAFSQLAGWSKATFNVSFSAVNIAKEIRADELDPEVIAVLTAIEGGGKVP